MVDKEKYKEALERCKKEFNFNNLAYSNEEIRQRLERVFPELKENKDENIIKFISHELACIRATDEKGSDRYKELTNAIAWLEKQGEHANFRNKIQIGDEVTRNEDGVLVNLSQLDRVAKKRVKQGKKKKSAWSEEDENAVEVIMNIIKKSEIIDSIIYTKPLKEELFDWLKSIKERMKGE